MGTMKVEIHGEIVEREIVSYGNTGRSMIGNSRRKEIALPQPYASRDEMVLWRTGSTIPMIVKIREDMEI